MSDNPSHERLAASRKLTPEVSPLESRLLLSQFETVRFPDGTSLVFPTFPHLPRTGGVSMQTGTILGIGVGQLRTNSVHVTDNGSGAVSAQWNGGPVHSFTGTTSSVIEVRRASTDRITFNLPGAPRTSPTDVAVGSRIAADSAIPGDRAHAERVMRMRTSGTAVQSGSVLTVTVTRHLTNTVAISNYGGGDVQVEWNGGTAHAFSGVETIVVDTHNATNNLVALHDVSG